MYKQFFGLRVNPFNVNPDPRFLYLTPAALFALQMSVPFVVKALRIALAVGAFAYAVDVSTAPVLRSSRPTTRASVLPLPFVNPPVVAL